MTRTESATEAMHLPPYPPPPTGRAGAGEPFDPYALSPDQIEDPPRGLLRSLRHIGPGLILAGAIVGTGELIATTNLGAKVGFVLLWLVIVSCFIKVFVQAELGRYAISSGDTTLAAFRRVPGAGAMFGWWWLVMMLLTQFQLGAMVGGVGQALHIAMPGVSPLVAKLGGAISTPFGAYLSTRPEVLWAVVAAVATSVLLAVGSYNAVEKGTTVLVVTFTLATVACVALLPWAGHPIDWSAVVGGLRPSLPSGDGAVAAALTMFGITGVGAAELVAYPYWCIEKGYARKAGPRDASDAWAARARGWLAVMRVDVWFSLVVYTTATLAFFALGAAVLHSRGGKKLSDDIGVLMNELAAMYAPVLGTRGALWFIVIGSFAVLYSTLYAATGANSRALADFLRVNGLTTFRAPEDRTRWVRRFCIAFPLIDLMLYLAFTNPVTMVTYGGLAQAATLPMLGVAALWLRYRRTDRRLAPGRLWDAFLWLSVVGLCLAAGYGAWMGMKKLLG